MDLYGIRVIGKVEHSILANFFRCVKTYKPKTKRKGGYRHNYCERNNKAYLLCPTV